MQFRQPSWLVKGMVLTVILVVVGIVVLRLEETELDRSIPITLSLASEEKQDPFVPAAMNVDDLSYTITGTSSQTAMDAGMELLHQGGSAMDAGLSAALSQIAVTGGKYVSYAGVLNLLYYEASSGRVHNLNAAYNSVLGEKDPSSIPTVNFRHPNTSFDEVTNGRTVLVPGFMKGVGAAHERFGKLPLENVFEHAIQVAEDGFEWSERDARTFDTSKQVLTAYDETKAIFTKPDGSYYEVGDTFKQPRLAATLRKITEEGIDYMYRGEWAEKFVDTVQAAGGKMSMEDMANYDVLWTEPVYVGYRDYVIVAHGKPAIGGLVLGQALKLAEVSGLSDRGHYSESAEALSALYHILVATAPFWNHSDWRKSVLTDEQAGKIWKTILKRTPLKRDPEAPYKSDHSASVVATDRWGNMVSILHSINTLNWGANGLFVDGVSIPDSATFQQIVIERVGPGNRITEATNPGLVFKGGKPILGFSCIGNSLTNHTFASLLNVLDFGMAPQEAIEAPSLGHFDFGAGNPNLILEADRIPPDIIESARKMNGKFEESERVISGWWSGVYRDYENSRLESTDIWLK